LEQQRRNILPDRHGNGRGYEEALREVGQALGPLPRSALLPQVLLGRLGLVELGGELLVGSLAEGLLKEPAGGQTG
jgi:hypothetical protein